MKYWIGYVVCWTCYWIGHFFSLFINIEPEWLTTIFYPPYNWFMLKSGDIQDWAGGDSPRFPWEKPLPL